MGKEPARGIRHEAIYLWNPTMRRILPDFPKTVRAHAGREGLIRQLVRDSRGASMVEYALMLFMVLVVAAAAVTVLGKTTRSSVDQATMTF